MDTLFVQCKWQDCCDKYVCKMSLGAPSEAVPDYFDADYYVHMSDGNLAVVDLDATPGNCR